MLNRQCRQGLEDTVGIVDDVALDEVKYGGDFGGIERAHASETFRYDSYSGVDVDDQVIHPLHDLIVLAVCSDGRLD